MVAGTPSCKRSGESYVSETWINVIQRAVGSSGRNHTECIPRAQCVPVRYVCVGATSLTLYSHRAHQNQLLLKHGGNTIHLRTSETRYSEFTLAILTNATRRTEARTHAPLSASTHLLCSIFECSRCTTPVWEPSLILLAGDCTQADTESTQAIHGEILQMRKARNGVRRGRECARERERDRERE